MQRKTYKNMEKAVNMIMAKGYDLETANKIAIQCFQQKEQTKNGMSVEWFIGHIANASEFC